MSANTCRAAILAVVLLSACPSAVCAETSPPVYSSITSINGISVVTLSGTAHDVGYSHGKLLGGRLLETEAAFKEIMPPIPLGWFGEMLLHWYVMMKVDDIEGYLTVPEIDELKGMESASPDPDRDYRELLYYHVLQDIGQYYACTGAAAFGGRSKTGGPVAGRNFDLNKDGALDALKTVFYIRPDYGYDYVSVAWPGMMGAVSGMNEHGLAVMEFSAKSEGAELEGVPVAFILKRVLLNARNVEEAVEVIKDVERMGPNIFLVADRERSVAVEFDTRNVLVREATDEAIAVTNHFHMPPLDADDMNVEYMEETDTTQRYERMSILLSGDGSVGVGEIANMLRDHKGPAGDELAPEDPAAVNNAKCAHSVMFDTKSLTLWVAKAPMAYGEYVGLRMTADGLVPVDTIPAGEYSRPETTQER